MNKINAIRTAVGGSLVTMGASVFAAVPEEITTALEGLSADAVEVAGLVLLAIVAVFAFKFIRKGL